MALIAIAPAISGCGSGVAVTPDGEVVDGNRDETLTSSLGKTSGEPNDSFSDAIVAVFQDDGAARLQGTVDRGGDLDVFLLGRLDAGDRVVVDTNTSGSILDVSIALFDAATRLVVNNDDRTPDNLDAYVDLIVRHEGDRYYLVVSHSAFAAPGTVTGTYRIDVTVSSGTEVPPPVGQVLLLDFSGADVNSPVLGSMALAPLDAADISPVYEGQTEALIDAIVATMEQNYERFNATVVTSDDPPPTEGMPVSTVYFGGFSPDMFGIAEDVDLYNADRCDDAIIFAESFSPQIFSRTPTTAELGLAIGNIAAHEAGHLLGLNHVSDDLALMDDQSAADAFIEDQEFTEAPLSQDIIPIGTQDAALLLSEIVGSVAD